MELMTLISRRTFFVSQNRLSLTKVVSCLAKANNTNKSTQVFFCAIYCSFIINCLDFVSQRVIDQFLIRTIN